jgi:hypothetical protein
VSGRRAARFRARALARLGTLAVLGVLVLGGAVPPHAHEASDAGLYDQEHDLRLLAMSSGGALVVAIPAAPVLAVAAPALPPLRAWPLPVYSRRETSRAPPVPLPLLAG